MNKQLREQALAIWLQNALNNPQLTIELVSGDASFRRYFRVLGGDTTMIAVDAPAPHEDCGLFLQVADAFRQHQVRVPSVIAADAEQGFMCLEDFGDRLFFSALSDSNKTQWYQHALQPLLDVANVEGTETGPLPSFDAAHVARENALFTDWLLATHLQLSLTAAEQTMIADAFSVLTDNALAQPQVGVHRDYHSRNIMLLDNDEIGVIDFQDAVLGPITYDVVSLLRDCYVEWPDEWVYQRLAEWATKARAQDLLESTEQSLVERWFDLMGIQRHVKASGIFCRLCHRDGKTSYLHDVPRTLGYIVRIAKKYPETREFGHFVEQRVIPVWRNQP
ncbi:cell wall phosphotransferase [Neiella marina]|uniref:Cell wall phosphotransferase n=1 Tax=Neiella marina TaxID=508461 RepID=A0A8J2U2Q4_9GAMM|nr:phosphotransferase [Neiella marina]GGA67808.1 cell wall phosphotransferase [Neiella marina]